MTTRAGLLRWSVSLVEPLVIALILLSALLHSGWNALVKLKSDPLVMLASVAGSDDVHRLLNPA